MRQVRTIILWVSLFVTGTIGSDAQGWLEHLGKRAEEAAKRRVERKVDKTVDKALDKAEEKLEKTAEKNDQKQKKKDKTSIVEPPDIGTPATDASDWDNGEPYYALKKGTKLTYTLYDGKSKMQGYSIQEIKEMTRTQSSVNAVVAGSFTDSKGKVQHAATVSLRFNNGNFHVDLLNMMLPKNMEGIDLETEVTGRDMIIPATLTPGKILPDAEASFHFKMKNGNEAFNLPPLVFRVFNRRAVRAEIVDTPMGKYVCFKIIQTVEADYPLIGKRQSTSITWIGKGMGVVKSEGYDAKGRLTSRMLLTRIE